MNKYFKSKEEEDEYNSRFIFDFSNLEIENKNKLVLSIDVGVIHLAMSVAEISNKYEFVKLRETYLINIKEFDCDRKTCFLFHDNNFTDQIAHVLYKYNNLFEHADYILIERQPPTGFVVIEQLLFCAHREKSVLISPNSVHAYFGIGNFTYEQRKVLSARYALPYIPDELGKELAKLDRVHDISDTILFILFWLHKKKEEKINIILQKKREEAIEKQKRGKKLDNIENFERYRYIPDGKDL